VSADLRPTVVSLVVSVVSVVFGAKLSLPTTTKKEWLMDDI
jgi:hypothetical protein